MTGAALVRTRSPPRLALWTLFMAALSVVSWVAFWLEYL